MCNLSLNIIYFIKKKLFFRSGQNSCSNQVIPRFRPGLQTKLITQLAHLCLVTHKGHTSILWIMATFGSVKTSVWFFCLFTNSIFIYNIKRFLFQLFIQPVLSFCLFADLKKNCNKIYLNVDGENYGWRW